MPTLHDQIKTLREQTDALELQLGDVCGQYVELTSALAPFLSRYHNEILRYHKALIMAKREVADVKTYLGDSSAIHEGEAESPLNEFLRREDVSVQEQYERTWLGKEPPKPIDPKFAPVSEELRQLYAKAVAHFHPDFARATADRRSRIPIFNQINAAYLRRDTNSVQMALGMVTTQSNLPAVVDDKIVPTMRNRLYEIEEVIARMEGQIYDFRHGEIAKIRAHASRAEAQGKDFITDLSYQIQRALRRTAEELAQLKKDIEQT